MCSRVAYGLVSHMKWSFPPYNDIKFNVDERYVKEEALMVVLGHNWLLGCDLIILRVVLLLL